MTGTVPATLPKTLAQNPRLSSWLTLDSSGDVTVRVGKVELGQGILTALAQIAADELDVDLDRIHMAAASTVDSPDEGATAGSLSIADSGAALRQVCAEVRALFLAEAAARLGLDRTTATVRDGVMTDAAGLARTSYGELAVIVDLDRDADGSARPKRADELRVVGVSVPRLDLPDKIAGRPRFIHDLTLPGQLYGRVVRPPSPAARLDTVETATVESLPGVAAVVRDGSFLGVVAESEAAADRAVSALRSVACWHVEPSLPDEEDLSAFLRAGPVETSIIDYFPDSDLPDSDLPDPDLPDPDLPDPERGPNPEPGTVARMAASYSRPFLAHASMAPSCGIAVWLGTSIDVWSHSQNIHALRRAIAMALDVSPGRVTVRHVEGAGCYGHNAADDAAFDAVLLARTVPGRPVQVRWSRRDELAWSPLGSAMTADVAAELDQAGRVIGWTYDVWSQGHVARPGYAGTPGLLAAAHLASRPHPLVAAVDPPAERGHGTARNAIPIYRFARRRIRAHRSLREGGTLRSSSLRSLGAFLNVFAIESFMDELALATGTDPLAYRLAHLTDPRARAVLEAAAELGGWDRRSPVAKRGSAEGRGHGIGFARYKNTGAYCAVVAEVEAVHEVRVRRLAIAVDVGRVVNPDGVRNQIEGGAIQATSWTLKERVRFDRSRVTSDDWETYPILRFSEVPEVDVRIMSRPDEASVGSGEAAQGPTAAAIANAVADATSARVRDLPITAARIIDAVEG